MDGRRRPAEIILSAAREAAADFQPALSLLPASFLALFGFEVRGKIRSRFTLFLDNRGVEVREGIRPEVMLELGFPLSAFYRIVEFAGGWWREGRRDALVRRMRTDPAAFARDFEEALDELRAMTGTIAIEMRDGRMRTGFEARLGESGMKEPSLKIAFGGNTLLEILTGKLEPGTAIEGGLIHLSGDPSVLLSVAPWLY